MSGTVSKPEKPLGPPLPSREAWNLANEMIAGSVKSPDYPHNLEEADRKAAAKRGEVSKPETVEVTRHPTQIPGNCPRCGAGPHRLNATPSRQDGSREALADRKAVNGVLAGLLAPYIRDIPELIAVGNQACAEILAALAALSDTPPPDNEETEALRGLLAEARDLFRFYESSHLAKIPALQSIVDADVSESSVNSACSQIEDTRAKARRNKDMADRIDAALSAFNNGGK